MKRILGSLLATRRCTRADLVLVATMAVIIFVLGWQVQATRAGPPLAPGGPVPVPCIEHTGFASGDSDLAGDYRCAGLAIGYHTGGVARSPKPIWAGQWLFVDENSVFRTGTCTFNRGIHPTIDQPSAPVAQVFPMDPGGAKGAYLTWRYGGTTDNLVAAGLWAVFHFYAQDAAGSNRAVNASAPLVPSLVQVSEMSGRQDIEDTAVALDAEATRLAGGFSLTIEIGADGRGVVHVRAAVEPVADAVVRLQVIGAAFDDDSASLDTITDAGGVAEFEVVGPAHEIEVIATTGAPGSAQVYRAAPADPVGHLPQTLITSGAARTMRAATTVVLAGPTTTTTTTTIEVPATTEAPATTAEVPAATTIAQMVTTTTEVPTTTTTTTTADASTSTTEPATTEPATTEPATTEPSTTTEASTSIEAASTSVVTGQATSVGPRPPASEIPVVTLPRTGSTGNTSAYLGTTLLVAGIGVLGAVRRRAGYSGPGDSG